MPPMISNGPILIDNQFRVIPTDLPGSEAIRASQRGKWMIEYLKELAEKPWVRELATALNRTSVRGVVCGFDWSRTSGFQLFGHDRELLVFTNTGEFRIATAAEFALNDWRLRLFGSHVTARNVDRVCEGVVVGIFPMNSTPADLIANILLDKARSYGISVDG
jgi:hypothetical protein